MAKIDDLKVRISRLEDELGVSYNTSTYKDEIDSSSTYLLYKYMQLLELKDDTRVRDDLTGANDLISMIESKDPDRLTAEEKGLLELKEDIAGTLSEKKTSIEEVSKKYKCEGEYEKVIWEPNSKYFSTEFMEAHKDDLDGIIEVNDETIKNLQEENDKFFGDKVDANDESNEEAPLSKIEQITEDRINENYEVLGIVEEENEFEDYEEIDEEEKEFEEEIIPYESKSDQSITKEEALEIRERLQAHFEGQALTEEQKETIEELNYLFQMGLFDEYKMLAEAEIQNIPVEEEEADPAEIEAMSDELIDKTIEENMETITTVEQEIEDADELGY